MSGPSGNTKQGQQASPECARAALENQDDRRARRPLEDSTGRSRERVTLPTNQVGTNKQKLDLPTGVERPVAREQCPDIPALLERYDVTAVPTIIYEWGGYRYTNPTDAIAAAKRGESA